MNSKLILSLVLALTLSSLSAMAAPRLKTMALVDDDVVRMGDVLEDAGSIADMKVAPAPAPGKRYSLRVSRIYAIAKRHGLDWRPRGVRSIVVERESKIVPYEVLVDALKEAAGDSGTADRTIIDLTNRSLVLYIPKSAEPTIAVDSFRHDSRTNRFTAIIRVPADDDSAPRVTINGRIHSMVEAPVLERAMAAGDVIQADDIVWKDLRVEDVSNGFVTDVDELVGFAAKRRIRPMHPVRSRDIQRPLLVRKGEPVTMSFIRTNLTLMTSGRALENGSRGEMIRVQNLRTKKTVEGTVVGAGRINVNMRADQVSSLK